jgi:hypothetical protein
MRKVVCVVLALFIVVVVGSVVRSYGAYLAPSPSASSARSATTSTTAPKGTTSTSTGSGSSSSSSVPGASTSAPTDDETIDPTFKEAMDSYEQLMNGYVDFMVKYKSSGNTASMLSEYGKFMQDYSKAMSKLRAIDENKLNSTERAYYLEVTGRVTQKMAEVM